MNDWYWFPTYDKCFVERSSKIFEDLRCNSVIDGEREALTEGHKQGWSRKKLDNPKSWSMLCQRNLTKKFLEVSCFSKMNSYLQIKNFSLILHLFESLFNSLSSWFFSINSAIVYFFNPLISLSFKSLYLPSGKSNLIFIILILWRDTTL